jgi:hypothetical protein
LWTERKKDPSYQARASYLASAKLFRGLSHIIFAFFTGFLTHLFQRSFLPKSGNRSTRQVLILGIASLFVNCAISIPMAIIKSWLLHVMPFMKKNKDIDLSQATDVYWPTKQNRDVLQYFKFGRCK